MNWRTLFFVVLVIEILAEVFEAHTIVYLFKPLLCAILIATLYKNPSKNELAPFVIGGLLLSLFGDVFLMIHPSSDLLFMLGLGSFLVAHLIYITGFTLKRRTGLKLDINMGLILSVAATAFYWMLPNLGELVVPVLVYVVVILTMWVTSGFRSDYRSATNPARFGATLFVLSDLVLAVNKFVMSIPYESIIVMSTYGLAQFYIHRSAIDKD